MLLQKLLITVPLILLIILAAIVFIPGCTSRADTAAIVAAYKTSLDSKTSSPADPQPVIDFLSSIGDKEYIKANTAKIYANDAYLNDTLVTHHGATEIEAYFLKTADNMTDYSLTIDDRSQSGNDHYLRWTMKFTVSSLGGGKPIHSIGMTHLRFNEQGKVTLHQDFWDSGTTIYGQAPILGGIIETVRKRLEK